MYNIFSYTNLFAFLLDSFLSTLSFCCCYLNDIFLKKHFVICGYCLGTLNSFLYLNIVSGDFLELS